MTFIFDVSLQRVDEVFAIGSSIYVIYPCPLFAILSLGEAAGDRKSQFSVLGDRDLQFSFLGMVGEL